MRVGPLIAQLQNMAWLKRPALPSWLVSRAVIFALLAVLVYSGALDPLERLLSDWRFKTASRPASQTLTVVEIDSASLRALDSWPWPRGYYATAIENLRNAGARNVGMDVDFSGRADPSEDAKLARVIAASNASVILPVFMQPMRNANGSFDLTEVQPNDRLRQGALFASVNLLPEADGVLRKGYFGFATPAGLRPSMAAALAGGAARTDAYYIDFGVSLPTVTRLSFADVLANKFDRKLVAGRNILIGATALELGDEFAVPVQGIASGVHLHALSYESIVQNRTLVRPSLLFVLLIALVVIAILGRERDQWSWLSVLAPHTAVFALAFGAPLALQMIWPVSMDSSPVLAAQLLCLARTVGSELERRAREIFRQRAVNVRQQALVTLAVKDSSDGIVVTDAVGRIELCNERAATLLGVCDPARIVGSSLFALAPDFPTYPTELAPSRDGRLVPADCFPVIRDYRLDDQVVEVSSDWTLCEEAQSKTVEGGHIYVHTLRDISARKRIEEAERQATASLVAASQAKSQFIHSMSHELRTPLNAVIGFSEMMCNQTAGPIGNPTYVEYVKMIHQGGRHLLSVVNDVLDVTRLETGDVKPDKEPVALARLIENVSENVEGEIAKAGRQLAIDVPEDLKLLIDRKLFGQTLQHLLANAVKFTHSGGHIWISARVEGEADAVVEVRDDGIGVEQAHLPKLTQAFFQADPSLSRTYGGTGLGLFLVTKYLALHGGRLELESEAGRGFLARIYLPNSVAAAPAPLQAVA
jgi:signal transduction histidine kinase/CHASE2 domain-containing sensor protein